MDDKFQAREIKTRMQKRIEQTNHTSVLQKLGNFGDTERAAFPLNIV